MSVHGLGIKWDEKICSGKDGTGYGRDGGYGSFSAFIMFRLLHIGSSDLNAGGLILLFASDPTERMMQKTRERLRSTQLIGLDGFKNEWQHGRGQVQVVCVS